MPIYIFLINHFVYQYAGNMLIPLWLALMINCPIWKVSLRRRPETNLDNPSAAIFKQDGRFLLPLYLYTWLDFLTWVWALVLFSETDSSAKYLLESVCSDYETVCSYFD